MNKRIQPTDQIGFRVLNFWRSKAARARTYGLEGMLNYAINVLIDYWFEFSRGISTRSSVELSELVIPSKNKELGVSYQPSRVRPLRRFFHENGVIPLETTFVDLGSGKGRVLFCAIEAGFKKAVGVEFSSELCGFALENVARYQKGHPSGRAIEVIQRDVATYAIRPDEGVFFMFNPFAAAIIASFLDNLRESVRTHPRKVFIVYHHAYAMATREGDDWLTEVGRYEYFYGDTFYLYSNVTHIGEP